MVRGQSIPGDACSNRLLFGEIERGGLRTALVMVGLYVRLDPCRRLLCDVFNVDIELGDVRGYRVQVANIILRYPVLCIVSVPDHPPVLAFS